MLGDEVLGDYRIQPGDTHISYFLMTPPFLLMGLDMYTLEIDFDPEGNFLSASGSIAATTFGSVCAHVPTSEWSWPSFSWSI